MAENTKESFPEVLRFIGGFGGFFWGATLGEMNVEPGFFIGGAMGLVAGAIIGWIAGKMIDTAILGAVLLISGILALIPAAIWGFRLYSYFAA